MSEAGQPNRGSVKTGVAVGITLNVVGGGLTFVIGNVSNNLLFVFVFFLIGATQLLWILPACIVFWMKRQPETVKGLAIMAGIVMLLNAACFGTLLIR